LFKNPVVRMGTLAAGFGMGTYIGLTIYLPVYLETVRGLSASLSGLALMPLMVGTVVGATISGRAMITMKHYRRLPVVGLTVAIAATGLLAAFADRLSLLWVEVLLAALSIGLGTLLPVTTVAVQNSVEPHEMGTATSTVSFFRSLGGAFLVAIFGAIVLGAAGLSGRALSFETMAAEAARSGVELSDVFRWMFLAATLGLALALAFVSRMEERPLKGRGPHRASATPE
jgi:predicted MFS family arabinose efflux permease